MHLRRSLQWLRCCSYKYRHGHQCWAPRPIASDTLAKRRWGGQSQTDSGERLVGSESGEGIWLSASDSVEDKIEY